METIQTIILLLSTALPLLGAALAFISKFIKSSKAKKVLEDLTLINTAISEFMIDAEKFKGYSGTEKKGYVLSCVKGFALDNGIDFNEDSATEAIEEFIRFSKSVNQKLKRTSKAKEVIDNG